MNDDKHADSPGLGRYVDKIRFQTDPDSSQEVRLVSHTELLILCDIFLALTRCRVDGRWPASKERRRDLGIEIARRLPAKWPDLHEWERKIGGALLKIKQKSTPCAPSDGEPWWGVESDIHIAAKCSRDTIVMFSDENTKHIPMATDTFIVPSAWGEVVGSLLSGTIRPVWVSCVDAADTPGVAVGLYPKYEPLQP